MQLTNLQLSAVNQILDLYNPAHKICCEFKSPTGSGKTLMASYFISALIDRYTDKKFIFVIATPSSSDLPLFFEQKLNRYKPDLPFSGFYVEYIQSPSSAKTDKTEWTPKIIPEQNKVYIFGKASFGKGRILSERGIIDDFVLSAIDQGFQLVYIRDEAHIGGNIDNTEEAKKFESLMNDNASFVLKMTATPNYKDLTTQKVILSETDLNDPNKNDGKYLLKTEPELLLKSDLEDDKVLEDAIKNFKAIKDEYKKLDIGIRPAMLIQVDNDSYTDKAKAEEFEKSIKAIKLALAAAGLSWAQYFGDNNKESDRVYKDKFTLDDLTENNSDIDVVIFKIGPSTGWDIPRACMLVQLRNVSSKNLNTQTIGRIKRNPYPELAKDSVTDKYYIYSNSEDIDKDIQIYDYQVREKFANETLLSIRIDNADELKKSKLSDGMDKDIQQFLENNKKLFKQDINNSFINDGAELFYKKIRSISKGNAIYSKITNPFIFLRDYKRMIQVNMLIYNNIFKQVDAFCEKEKLCSEFLFIILFEKYKTDLTNLINKHKQWKPKYKIIEEPYKPKSYIEIFDGQPKNEERISREYLFDINPNNETNKNKQPLDSKNEAIVFGKIYNFSENGNIKLWAKNLTCSNVSGEYIDENNSKRHSFFDFIIKFNNGFYLYIEVKGKNDIDADKTAMLKKAYKDYFDKMETNLFTKKLAISVWKVADDGSINYDIFYDQKQIPDDLSTLSIDNLLQKLSQ